MPIEDSRTTAALERIENKLEKLEEPVVKLREDMAGVKARLEAMEKANQTEAARASEDRGGTRQWLGMAGGWLLGLISLCVALFKHK